MSIEKRLRMNLERLRERARVFHREVYAVYLACRDPRTPWYAKLLGAIIVAYALSPIDLIPDFIPVVGYLDDLLIVPLGVTLLLKIIPKEVLDECRIKAANQGIVKRSWFVPFLIVVLWLAFGIWLVRILWKLFLAD